MMIQSQSSMHQGVVASGVFMKTIAMIVTNAAVRILKLFLCVCVYERSSTFAAGNAGVKR